MSDIATRLELIASKAKILAMEYKNGKLWPGELSKGLQELQEQLSKALQETRTDR